MKLVPLSSGWLVRRPNGPYQPVDLPHDGSISLPRDPNAPGGADTGYFVSTDLAYVRHLRLPAETKHALLDIDGAYMCATVSLNENQLDVHPHGYAPLLVDLSAAMHPGGVDKLVVETSGLQPSTRWYSGSGLYRDVFLWTGGETRIGPRDVFVVTESATKERAVVRIDVVVTADADVACTLSASLRGPGRGVVASHEEGLSLAAGRNALSFRLQVDAPALWDIGSPSLYKLALTLRAADGTVLDTATETCGIRTIEFGAERGFLLNGRPTKLRGGCVHHDHGVLGACSFPAAEERRVHLLLDAGFNAIRTAHHPPSRVLLEVCDRLGMLVMDEAFDMWNRAKRPLDYHLWFAHEWRRDVEAMVLRDRNHPCVVSYSIGNEIAERNGHSDGTAWAGRLAGAIRSLDATRPVTAAICGLWDYPSPDSSIDPPDCVAQNFAIGATGFPDRNDKYFAQCTESICRSLDIVGYNYMHDRYVGDHERYPGRVIWGSETFALTFYDSWSLARDLPYVLGDFVWTAFDYLGEVGIGRFAWFAPGEPHTLPVPAYPWRTAFDADFDLCGTRRPQSYFRRALWQEDADALHLFATPPQFRGQEFAGTCWHWRDVHETWNFADEWLGKPVDVEVYTTADRVEFSLNGSLVATVAPVKAVAVASVPYARGELTAVAYRGEREVARGSISSTGPAAALRLEAECPTLCANRRDIAYIQIALVDVSGRRVPESKAALTCHVYNGELLGIFSADPANEDAYTGDTCHAFEGRALALVRTDFPGQVEITVTSPGLPAASCTVTAQP